MENVVKNKTDLWFEWGTYILKATAGVWFPTSLSAFMSGQIKTKNLKDKS